MVESVDLKWSLWTTDESVWDEHAPQVLERMRGAFGGTANPILIHTGPKKETRYGSVSIEQGKAYVEFYALWDSPHDLVPDDCPEELLFNLLMFPCLIEIAFTQALIRT